MSFNIVRPLSDAALGARPRADTDSRPPVEQARTALAQRSRCVRCPAMGRAPSGTVTFLFTDVVGSTGLWERAPDAMRVAIARHDALLDAVIAGHGGYVFAPGGDGMAAAFGRAGDAVRAAVAGQRGLLTEPWPDTAVLSVRMGLHSGETDERAGGYFGTAVNRAARVMSTARGGQILLSTVTAGLLPNMVGVEFV